jgi:hypothetical protein
VVRDLLAAVKRTRGRKSWKGKSLDLERRRRRRRIRGRCIATSSSTLR